MTDQEIKAAADGLGMTAKELKATATRLGLEIGVKDLSTCIKLMRGHFDANGCQRMLGGLYKPEFTLKQMREELEKIERALQKIIDDRGTTEAAYKSIAAALKEIPPEPMRNLETFDLNIPPMPYDPPDGALKHWLERLPNMDTDTRKTIAKRLLDTVKAALDGLITPGKGNARKQAHTYTPGIECLMKHFREALPDRQISETDDSTFSLYVALWIGSYEATRKGQLNDENMSTFTKYADWITNHSSIYMKSPRRHIQSAIADLERWKKISL